MKLSFKRENKSAIKTFFFLSMVQWWHWISKFPFDGRLLASLWVVIHSFLCVCELAITYNSNEMTTGVRLFQMWFHCLKINRLSWMPSRLYITNSYVMCSHQFLWLGVSWITEALYDNFFFFRKTYCCNITHESVQLKSNGNSFSFYSSFGDGFIYHFILQTPFFFISLPQEEDTNGIYWLVTNCQRWQFWGLWRHFSTLEGDSIFLLITLIRLDKTHETSNFQNLSSLG